MSATSLRPSGILGLVVLATACVSPVEENEAVRRSMTISGHLPTAMSEVRTISLHPSARFVETTPTRVQEVRASIDAAIARTFRRAGYRVAMPGQGDRVIAYAIGTADIMSDAKLFEVFGIAAGLDPGAGPARGGIVLAIMDRQRQRVLWRASGSGSAGDGSAGILEMSRRIQGVIDELLKDLPRAEGS